MTRVVVVIPNWNGRQWLGPCLGALAAQTYRDFRVIVVDNGSGDGSVAYLRADWPGVQVCALPVNLGFAAGMNAGFAAAGPVAYLAALNNDTEAEPGWLASLVAGLDAQPQAGSAASLMVSLRDPQVVDTAGDGYGWAGMAWKLGAGGPRSAVPDAPYPVFGASAGACLYRREMLEAVGTFDPGYFAYMEDVDLALRAQMAGWGCVAVPGAVVRHAGAASSGGGPSVFSVRLSTRNALVTILKSAPGPLVPVMLALALAAQAGAVALSLLTGRPAWIVQHRQAWAAGVGEALRAAPGAMAARKRAAPLRRMGVLGFARLLRACARQRARFGKVAR